MKLVFTVSLIAALTTASPAFAQATGSRITGGAAKRQENTRNPTETARKLMYDFAECVVKRSGKNIRRFMNTAPGTKAARDLADSFATDDCISAGEMTMNERLMRGAVYENLYVQEFKAAKAPGIASALPVGSSATAAGSEAENANEVALRTYAACVVLAAPESTRALVLTRVGTQAERTAFTAVMPLLSSCLDEKAKLAFSPSVLRGLIAEVLYKLTKAGAAVGAASVGRTSNGIA